MLVLAVIVHMLRYAQMGAGPPPRSRVNSGATPWRGGSPPRGRGRVGSADQQSGVYYLHAAALAFCLGLLTSYGLSIAWVFQARTWQHPWV